jgi:hypothetical protein
MCGEGEAERICREFSGGGNFGEAAKSYFGGTARGGCKGRFRGAAAVGRNAGASGGCETGEVQAMIWSRDGVPRAVSLVARKFCGAFGAAPDAGGQVPAVLSRRLYRDCTAGLAGRRAQLRLAPEERGIGWCGEFGIPGRVKG